MTLLTLNKRCPERLALWNNDVDDLKWDTVI